jgi:hypothetical protein
MDQSHGPEISIATSVYSDIHREPIQRLREPVFFQKTLQLACGRQVFFDSEILGTSLAVIRSINKDQLGTVLEYVAP